MNSAVGLKHHITFIIAGFKLVSAMWLHIQLYHFCTHPLCDNLRLYICFKQQVQWQVECAGDQQILLAFFGMYFSFRFHFIYFLD
ncbi:hypothetical protein D3C72_1553520 [compost metagenome]